MDSKEAVGVKTGKVTRRFRGRFWRIFALSLALLLGLLAFQSWPLIRAELDRREARAEIIEAIATAPTPHTMREAAFVYVLPDGSWIATQYQDSHSWPGYSVAMAVTSDGTWYESREHHCGGFWSYASALHTAYAFLEALPSEAEEDRRRLIASCEAKMATAEFAPVAEAATLSEAEQALRALGFAARRISRPPALRGPQEWPAPSPDVLSGSTQPRIITGRTLPGGE